MYVCTYIYIYIYIYPYSGPVQTNLLEYSPEECGQSASKESPSLKFWGKLPTVLNEARAPARSAPCCGSSRRAGTPTCGAGRRLEGRSPAGQAAERETQREIQRERERYRERYRERERDTERDTEREGERSYAAQRVAGRARACGSRPTRSGSGGLPPRHPRAGPRAAAASASRGGGGSETVGGSYLRG